MLTKRTHILFDEETAHMLASLADRKQTSVGDLVRRAVEKAYRIEKKQVLNQRKKAVRQLFAWQKKIGTFKNIDYRALIEHGRRY